MGEIRAGGYIIGEKGWEPEGSQPSPEEATEGPKTKDDIKEELDERGVEHASDMKKAELAKVLYEDMTKDELMEELEARELDFRTDMKKAQLIRILKKDDG